MTSKNKVKTNSAQRARQELPARIMRRKGTAQRWHPQPSGISREEMRQIVLEMIG